MECLPPPDHHLPLCLQIVRHHLPVLLVFSVLLLDPSLFPLWLVLCWHLLAPLSIPVLVPHCLLCPLHSTDPLLLHSVLSDPFQLFSPSVWSSRSSSLSRCFSILFVYALSIIISIHLYLYMPCYNTTSICFPFRVIPRLSLCLHYLLRFYLYHSSLHLYHHCQIHSTSE